MMNTLFLALTSLGLILFQTVVFPCFSWFDQSFDLVLLIVLFLSLVYSHYAVVLAIVLIGGVMDSLSGVAFFHHIFSYLWIFLIVQLFKQFVFQRSILFILIISLVSVLIQQGMILFSIFIRHGSQALWQIDFSLMARQLLWGGLLIPPGIWIIRVARHNFLYMARMIKKQWVKKYRG